MPSISLTTIAPSQVRQTSPSLGIVKPEALQTAATLLATPPKIAVDPRIAVAPRIVVAPRIAVATRIAPSQVVQTAPSSGGDLPDSPAPDSPAPPTPGSPAPPTQVLVDLDIVEYTVDGDRVTTVLETENGCYRLRSRQENPRPVEEVLGARYSESVTDVVRWLHQTTPESIAAWQGGVVLPIDPLLQQRVQLGEAERLESCPAPAQAGTTTLSPSQRATRGMNPIALLAIAGIGYLLVKSQISKPAPRQTPQTNEAAG